jgi:hypothetical protein
MARGPPECPLRSDHVVQRLCSWAHPPYISSPEHLNFILLREHILHLRQELNGIKLTQYNIVTIGLPALLLGSQAPSPSLPSCRILPTPPAELSTDKSGIETFFFSIRHLQHGFWQALALSLRVTCYALATHRPIYSYFPALRAPSFLTIIPIYTHIYPHSPPGLDTSERVNWSCCSSSLLRSIVFTIHRIDHSSHKFGMISFIRCPGMVIHFVVARPWLERRDLRCCTTVMLDSKISDCPWKIGELRQNGAKSLRQAPFSLMTIASKQ